MSRTKTTARPIEQVLALLEGVRPGSNGWSALCPAHDDTNPSLSVTEADGGKVLIKCHGGCDVEDIVAAMGLRMQDLFPTKRARAADQSANGAGLTLEQYAETKSLPSDFLRKLRLATVYLQGTPAVSMPYLDMNGEAAASRFRLAMNDEPRFMWRRGSKPCLYGLWRLRNNTAKYICVVEGESDCHTLWRHRFPALGLPGASAWNEQWAEYFDGYERIYVVIEPDKGGEAVLQWLSNSKIRDRARLITLDGAKDPSELYLAQPEDFTESWKAAMSSAITWSKVADLEKKSKLEAAWSKCEHLASQPDILSLFADALEKRGVAGETRPAKVVYLSVTSRHGKRPVSLFLEGPSSSGKSHVVERTLGFFPSSAYYALTAMSERALAYSTEPLSHRFLVLYEAAALKGDFLSYVVRSLLSEGRLRYETVEKTKNGLRARVIEREGPTGLIMTTTAVRQHPENETRHLAIPVSDTPGQTKRVLRAIACIYMGDRNAEQETDLSQWLALQEWLEYANHEVVIPYAGALAELVPPVAVRLRRDFTAILNLVEAHAMLHQATRSVDEHGRIVAKLKDYGAVRDLVHDYVSQGVEQTVPKTMRQTVNAVAQICSENFANGERAGGYRDDRNVAAVQQVAKALAIDRSAASRRVQQCLTRGYIKNLETKPGQAHRLVVGDPFPEEETVMPTPEEVLEEWKRMR